MAASERPQLHTYLIVSREAQPPQVVVWDTARIRIGRHPEQDVVLDDPEVSRQHALLRRDGEKCSVEDLGTANGTFVNDEPVRTAELQPDDVIRIGGSSFHFCQSGEDPAESLSRVVLASRLRGYQPLAEDAHGSTMLGLPAEDDALWNVGARPGPPAPPVVRDLDDEIDGDEASEFGSLDDPDPLMASAFDLGEPLPPVGRMQPPTAAAGAGGQGAATAPRVVEGGPQTEAASVELTLQLDGVAPDLLALLQSLLGRRLDLRALCVLLKGLSIR